MERTKYLNAKAMVIIYEIINSFSANHEGKKNLKNPKKKCPAQYPTITGFILK